jgi:peptidoglycan/LPS O-acetylase OafA/YrhL
MISHFAPVDMVGKFPLGYGVLFFFVLSSFLITRILLTSKQYNETAGIDNVFSLRQFYLRRFLRIFPVYYLLVLFMYVINWVPCRQIIEYLVTYTINFKIASGYDAASFNHLWSLAVEEQFYIFFPFFVFFVNTKYLPTILISFVLVGLFGRGLLYAYDTSNISFSNFHTISCLDSLGIGGLLGYLSVYKVNWLRRIISKKTLFASSVLLFFLIMTFSFTVLPQSERYNVVSIVLMRFSFNVMSFWVLGWAVTINYSGIIKAILENRIVVYLGKISYGLYLYHLFVPQLINIVFKKFHITLISSAGPGSVISVVTYFATTIIIASGSWFLLENPINGLKKYFNYNRKLKLQGDQAQTL